MRVLVLMAEYGMDFCNAEQLPLWEGHTLVEDIKLDKVLTDVAQRWNRWYERISDDNGTFEDDFVTVGRNLARNIKMDLGNGVELWYMNENTLKRELIE